MEKFKVLAYTHKQAGLQQVGRFHMPQDEAIERLTALKLKTGVSELMYLSTCNRVEFYMVGNESLTPEFVQKFITAFHPSLSAEAQYHAAALCECYEGDAAIRHVFSVASSLDSLVVGEREIITQVRNAYEFSHKAGLTGDFIRLLMKKTIETAKEVYSCTHIASRPVSVVSLAFKRLQEMNLPANASVVLVGAGVTNTTMARFMRKYGYRHFTIFNRTVENAKKLAAETGGEGFSLNDLRCFNGSFDVLVTCTASAEPVITSEIYADMLNGDTRQKVIIDLAVPGDLHPDILQRFNVKLINVDQLKITAEKNLKEREKELVKCNDLVDKCMIEFREMYKIRQVELAMSQVPEKVREIKENALRVVFARELEGMDVKNRELLEKVLSYLEKKYISVPMKLAREILLEQQSGKTGNPVHQPIHLN